VHDLLYNVKQIREDVAVPKSPESEGSPRLMTVTEIAAEHGVSRQTIHTYRRTGIFPSPVEGEGSTRPRFREDEVDAFFKANPKQPRKKRRPQPQQGEPVTTTTEARSELYAFAMQGKEHSPEVSERASQRIDAFRAAVVTEVVDALMAKGTELSELAEAEMRQDLEETAQVWLEAAEVARRLKRAKPTTEG
jgi:predicted DNA-binding transcriptional regulator AlpA